MTKIDYSVTDKRQILSPTRTDRTTERRTKGPTSATTMEKLEQTTEFRMRNSVSRTSRIARIRSTKSSRIFWIAVSTVAFLASIVPALAFDDFHRSRNHTKSDCYKAILHHCGRQFIDGYKLLSKGVNIAPDDVFTTQCTLRTSFFNCITDKTRDCKRMHGEADDTKFEDIYLGGSGLEAGTEPNTLGDKRLPRRVNRFVKRSSRGGRRGRRSMENFRKRLSDTIWKSRVCIFRSNVKPTTSP